MKKFGFTLAEVLITLAIIGVVAAITLPSLNDDMGLRSIEKQSAKFYNTLVNSISMIQADEQVDDISSINLTPEMILSRMKVKRTCAVKDCAPAQYGYVNSSNKKTAAEIFSGISVDKDYVTLPEQEQEKKEKLNAILEETANSTMTELEDGTIVYMSQAKQESKIETDKNNTTTTTRTTQPLTIYFDVNGKKGPNIVGRDLWAVSIYDDGKIDDTKLQKEETSKKNGEDIITNSEENLFNSSYSFSKFRNNGFKFNCK